MILLATHIPGVRVGEERTRHDLVFLLLGLHHASDPSWYASWQVRWQVPGFWGHDLHWRCQLNSTTSSCSRRVDSGMRLRVAMGLTQGLLYPSFAGLLGYWHHCRTQPIGNLYLCWCYLQSFAIIRKSSDYNGIFTGLRAKSKTWHSYLQFKLYNENIADLGLF
ncbi:hypothetical protein evm_014954 [Chilo suppressalis]|nr:hypothetical protein evm_014954 [Chilo suppressalis]